MKSQSLGAPLALCLLLTSLANAGPALAASGGRISGGSFRSPSSPSYSRSSSRSSGGFGSSYSRPARTAASHPPPSYSRSYNDFEAPIVVRERYRSPSVVVPVPVPVASPTVVVPAPVTSPPVVYSNGSAQSNGNPWLGLIFLLVLSAGVIAFLSLLRWDERSPVISAPSLLGDKATVTKIQVALLASAKDLRTTLIRLANNVDTSTEAGLEEVLRDSCLTILRNPDLIVYADHDTHVGYLPAIEQLFNKKTVEERSKLDEEIVTNIAGKHRGSSTQQDLDSANEYIAVTILLASFGVLKIPGTESMEDLIESLIAMGSVEGPDILGLEVLWQPEGKGETLSRDELLGLYPDLQNV